MTPESTEQVTARSYTPPAVVGIDPSAMSQALQSSASSTHSKEEAAAPASVAPPLLLSPALGAPPVVTIRPAVETAAARTRRPKRQKPARTDPLRSRSRRLWAFVLAFLVWSLFITVADFYENGDTERQQVSAVSEDAKPYVGITFTGSDAIGSTFTFTLEETGTVVFHDYNGNPGSDDEWTVENGELKLTVTAVPLGNGEFAPWVEYKTLVSDTDLTLDMEGVDGAGRVHHLTASPTATQ